MPSMVDRDCGCCNAILLLSRSWPGARGRARGREAGHALLMGRACHVAAARGGGRFRESPPEAAAPPQRAYTPGPRRACAERQEASVPAIVHPAVDRQRTVASVGRQHPSSSDRAEVRNTW
jgi:hypothetical protein